MFVKKWSLEYRKVIQTHLRTYLQDSSYSSDSSDSGDSSDSSDNSDSTDSTDSNDSSYSRVIPYESTEKNMTIFFFGFLTKNVISFCNLSN